MKDLDDLFQNARQATPPLSKQDAQSMIAARSMPIAKGGKALAIKTVLLVTASAVTVALLTLVPRQNAETPKVSSGNINRQEKPLSAPARTAPDLQNHGVEPKAVSSKDQVAFAAVQGHDGVGNQVLQTPPGFISDDDYPGDIAVTTEAEPLLQAEKDDQSDSGVLATGPLNLNPPAPDSVKKRKREEKPRAKRNFLRTELLGYFYNALPQVLFRTQYLDPKSLSGGKVSVAYERLLGEQISAGIQFNYGFAPSSKAIKTSYQSVFPVTEELFVNYKGFWLSLDGRYYIKKRSNGTGLFASAFVGGGSFEERVYTGGGFMLTEKDLRTLKISRGTTLGVGIGAGYKFMLGGFYAEPHFAWTLAGLNTNYYNWSYLGQSNRQRYNTLNRFEINVGYNF